MGAPPFYLFCPQGDLATAQRKLRELEDRHRNKVAELSAVLAERQALLLETQDALRANGLREEGDGVPSDCEAERAKPDRGRGEDGGRGGGRRKIERLRLKLKTQTKQTNYLRLRLGQPSSSACPIYMCTHCVCLYVFYCVRKLEIVPICISRTYCI